MVSCFLDDLKAAVKSTYFIVYYNLVFLKAEILNLRPLLFPHK
jgi:hypothetical protein